MIVKERDLAIFQERGILFLDEVLTTKQLSFISKRVEEEASHNWEGRVLERDGKTPRALHGCHLNNPLFERLVRLPTLLESAKLILESDVYLYQFKINIKAAFRGDAWPWHQDYIFWRNEDGMPEPRAISVLIFLDDVTEFNGPIFFMPGSHKEGCIDLPASEVSGIMSWHNTVTADLKYRIGEEKLGVLANRYGLEAPKGPSGSALFFHCNIVHGSPQNISPFSRRLLILTYNAVDNTQQSDKPPRPEFLVARNFLPLQSLDDESEDALLGCCDHSK
ncbi:MAG TPA: phytanoyl-CoA dioxygenase family protein [Methylocella sp.]|nr:phytanoyl-CoA dioxygenase family protein [Methylocella sp.]